VTVKAENLFSAGASVSKCLTGSAAELVALRTGEIAAAFGYTVSISQEKDGEGLWFTTVLVCFPQPPRVLH